MWKPSALALSPPCLIPGLRSVDASYCVLFVRTECSHAPASCRCWYVRGSSRWWWACLDPGWSPPPAPPWAPPCRCLLCRTAAGNAVDATAPLSNSLYRHTDVLCPFQVTEGSASGVSWRLCQRTRSGRRTPWCSDRHRWRWTSFHLVGGTRKKLWQSKVNP